jgi:hypothetical protein
LRRETRFVALFFVVLCACGALGAADVRAAEFFFGRAGGGDLWLVYDDGTAFTGTFVPCPYCPPTDTLNWSPASCGNILSSAGRSGDRILLLSSSRSGGMSFVTDRGYICYWNGGCWSTVLEGLSVFQRLGSPPEAMIGAGTVEDGLYLLTESGNAISVGLASNPNSISVTRLGHVSGFGPTRALPSSWGQLKSRYR